MKRYKGKYGFYYNNPYDIAGKAIDIPLNTTAGYAQGLMLGQGLGLDNQGQRNLGAMSAANVGLSSIASLIQTVRRDKEERQRMAKQFSNEYYKVPYDRYSYQSNLNDPYQPNAFKNGGYKDGGLPVSNYGQYKYPGKPVRVPSNFITMRGVNYPVHGISNKGQHIVMQPNKDYYFEGAGYVDEYPMKNGGIHIKKENRGKFTAAAKRAGMGVQEYAKKVLKDPNASATLKKRANFARNAAKWQDGGEVSYYDTPGEDIIFDAIPEMETMEQITINSESSENSAPEEFNYSNFNPKPFYNQQLEGGTIAVTHNNPGNIKWSKFAQTFGATEGKRATDGGTFAVFPDIETGLKAQRELLTSKNYRNLTVDAAMKRWSNHGYGAEIFPEIATKKMGQLTELELKELQKRQIRREDINMYKKLYQ